MRPSRPASTGCSFLPCFSLRAMFPWAGIGIWRPRSCEVAWVTSTALFPLCCSVGQQPCSPWLCHGVLSPLPQSDHRVQQLTGSRDGAAP